MILIFIAKESGICVMNDFRGVLLLNTVLKWYSNCLVLLLERAPVSSTRTFGVVASFGFRARMSCAQITGGLRVLLSKGWEWQQNSPIVVFVGDVLQAFDYMTPECVQRALEKRGTHPRLAAALLREARGWRPQSLSRTPSSKNGSNTTSARKQARRRQCSNGASLRMTCLSPYINTGQRKARASWWRGDASPT